MRCFIFCVLSSLFTNPNRWKRCEKKHIKIWKYRRLKLLCMNDAFCFVLICSVDNTNAWNTKFREQQTLERFVSSHGHRKYNCQIQFRQLENFASAFGFRHFCHVTFGAIHHTILYVSDLFEWKMTIYIVFVWMRTYKLKDIPNGIGALFFSLLSCGLTFFFFIQNKLCTFIFKRIIIKNHLNRSQNVFVCDLNAFFFALSFYLEFLCIWNVDGEVWADRNAANHVTLC